MAEVVDADVFLVSHTHTPMILRKKFFRVDYRNNKVTEVDQLFVNTNAFLNYGGYGESFGYSPTSTKYPKIILNGIERKTEAIL